MVTEILEIIYLLFLSINMKHKNYTGEQMPTKKELEKRRDKRKQEEAEKNPKPKVDETKKDTEVIKKQPEANKTKKHK